MQKLEKSIYPTKFAKIAFLLFQKIDFKGIVGQECVNIAQHFYQRSI